MNLVPKIYIPLAEIYVISFSQLQKTLYNLSHRQLYTKYLCEVANVSLAYQIYLFALVGSNKDLALFLFDV